MQHFKVFFRPHKFFGVSKMHSARERWSVFVEFRLASVNHIFSAKHTSEEPTKDELIAAFISQNVHLDWRLELDILDFDKQLKSWNEGNEPMCLTFVRFNCLSVGQRNTENAVLIPNVFCVDFEKSRLPFHGKHFYIPAMNQFLPTWRAIQLHILKNGTSLSYALTNPCYSLANLDAIIASTPVISEEGAFEKLVVSKDPFNCLQIDIILMSYYDEPKRVSFLTLLEEFISQDDVQPKVLFINGLIKTGKTIFADSYFPSYLPRTRFTSSGSITMLIWELWPVKLSLSFSSPWWLTCWPGFTKFAGENLNLPELAPLISLDSSVHLLLAAELSWSWMGYKNSPIS